MTDRRPIVLVDGEPKELPVLDTMPITSSMSTATHAATAKTTPEGGDEFPLSDSAATWALKKVTWTNIKAALKTYFDTLYAAVAHAHAQDAVTVSKLVASDGSPDPAVSVNAGGHTTVEYNLYTKNIVKIMPDTGSAALYIESATAADPAYLFLRSNVSTRWGIYKDTTTESGSNAGSNFVIARYADNGSDIATVMSIARDTGNTTFAEYTKLGSSGPAIKTKTLIGTTAATQGGVTNIAHGETLSKIIGWQVTVDIGGARFMPEHLANAGYQFSAHVGGINTAITNSSSNSANILSKSIEVTLIYKA